MHDIAIIGGGIVGISVAWQLQLRYPAKSIVVLEKERDLAMHQTSHNSGVMHAGVYYEPGSLKARLCKAGVAATAAFCRDNHILYEQCGKLIVATDDLEYDRLLALQNRARQNGLDTELLNRHDLQTMEPNVSGTGALLVRTTGIVSYSDVCKKMAERFQAAGGRICLASPVTALSEKPAHVDIQCDNGLSQTAKFVIACGGLQADRLARMMGINVNFVIVPFRGEYYRLPSTKSAIVNHLIYPVPDPSLPFLGIHLTRMIDGSITVGPNALQGWKREGYERAGFDVGDAWAQLSFPGFWKLAGKHLGTGFAEIRNSIWKRGYVEQVKKYCPSIELSDLLPYPAGIRAIAVKRDGKFAEDFLFVRSARSLHVCSAPSPAATSAIPIGNHICDLLEDEL